MTLRWETDGRDWPLREHSRFIETAGIRWHVQQFGSGPTALLIHGTGASGHSWRDVAPLLADRFTLIIPDLPGHGFTRGRPSRGLTLKGMAGAVGQLLVAVDSRPAVVAAHSAGAAIACQMALDGSIKAPIVGFCPALLPMGGAAAPIFSGVAKLLFLNPLTTHLVAGMARQPGRIDRFLERATGSRIDAEGTRLYGRLFTDPEHVAGTIGMMASWDLAELERGLPQLPVPLTVAQGERDRAIKPADARRAAHLAQARFELMPELGHLAHEERPDLAAQLIACAAKGEQ